MWHTLALILVAMAIAAGFVGMALYIIADGEVQKQWRAEERRRQYHENMRRVSR